MVVGDSFCADVDSFVSLASDDALQPDILQYSDTNARDESYAASKRHQFGNFEYSRAADSRVSNFARRQAGQ